MSGELKQTILVVDDCLDLLAIQRRMIERDGFTVQIAATIAEARAVVAALPPDLILLDINLPDGSGIDFLRELRQTLNIPIIIVTARTDMDTKTKAFEAGCDDFINKPFLFDTLRKCVKKQLSNSAGWGDS